MASLMQKTEAITHKEMTFSAPEVSASHSLKENVSRSLHFYFPDSIVTFHLHLRVTLISSDMNWWFLSRLFR